MTGESFCICQVLLQPSLPVSDGANTLSLTDQTKTHNFAAAGNRFYDFEQMRQEILQETERITGANKGISDKAIRLKISSPHVL